MANGFTLDVTELEDYTNAVRWVADTGAKQFSRIGVKYRNLAVKEARRLVRKKTWALHDSIQPKRNSAGRIEATAEFEVGAPYAGFIEYGFVHWRSQKFVGPFPYVRPALKKYRRSYTEEIATAAKDSLKVTKTQTRKAVGSVVPFGSR